MHLATRRRKALDLRSAHLLDTTIFKYFRRVIDEPTAHKMLRKLKRRVARLLPKRKLPNRKIRRIRQK
jgi:hypothetical protein